ncbi:MAG: MBL fold metallo-hydrolase [candidate division Zixibacteria bacterium]|nr:MBL fold metallo-hydrolase [candidate division Zixibacteria bacterium]
MKKIVVSIVLTVFLFFDYPTVFAQNAGRTRVVILGTGTPNADPERSGPGVAIVVDSTAYLVDCGPGIVRRAAAAARKGVKGLDAKNLEHVFISHLHSDHTIGLPDLIFTTWVLERENPLRAFGPAGLKEMTDHLLKAYASDIENRLDGLQPATKNGYHVETREIRPGVVYEDERVRVTAFYVDHGTWKESFGYRFDTPDRSVVVSGDCIPSPELIRFAKGCDVLIHEVFSTEGFKRRPPEWQRYHARSHTSTAQLADIARQTQPGLLVMYHQLFWGTTDDELVKEIRAAGYDGNVVSAKDLDVY